MFVCLCTHQKLGQVFQARNTLLDMINRFTGSERSNCGAGPFIGIVDFSHTQESRIIVKRWEYVLMYEQIVLTNMLFTIMY